jgi:hypothetical protein
MFLRVRNVSDKKVKKTETHILGSMIFFSENCAIFESVDEHGTARKATYDSTLRHRKYLICIPGN